MGLDTRKREVEQVLGRLVPRVIHELLDPQSHRDTDQLYRRAVGLVVEALLSQVEPNEAPRSLSGAINGPSSLTELAQEIGPLTPAEVGEIYEYLRGFKVEVKSPGQWAMVPNVTSKRNQGLFYTPKAIVSYIVEQTLDALDVREPSHYLDLRILDPAVGTGMFLTEALDKLTDRVVSAMRLGDKLLLNRVDIISERLQVKGVDRGICGEHDKEAAVRIHMLQNCLYGVDLDPIAVNIAWAALLTRSFGQRRVMPELEPHVRIGNALIGEGPGDPHGSSKENCGPKARGSVPTGNSRLLGRISVHGLKEREYFIGPSNFRRSSIRAGADSTWWSGIPPMRFYRQKSQELKKGARNRLTSGKCSAHAKGRSTPTASCSNGACPCSGKKGSWASLFPRRSWPTPRRTN